MKRIVHSLLLFLCYSNMLLAMEEEPNQEILLSNAKPYVTKLPKSKCAKLLPAFNILYIPEDSIGVYSYNLMNEISENITPGATSVGDKLYVDMQGYRSKVPSFAVANVNQELEGWSSNLQNTQTFRTQAVPTKFTKQTISFAAYNNHQCITYSRNGEKPTTIFFDRTTGEKTDEFEGKFYEFISNDGIMGLQIAKENGGTGYASSFVIKSGQEIQKMIDLPSVNVSASPDARMLASFTPEDENYNGIQIFATETGQLRNTIKFASPLGQTAQSQFSSKGAILAVACQALIKLYSTASGNIMTSLQEPNKLPIINLQVQDLPSNQWYVGCYAKNPEEKNENQENQSESEFCSWTNTDSEEIKKYFQLEKSSNNQEDSNGTGCSIV